MPVILIGADTATGMAIASSLLPRDGEVRAFVTDPEAAAALKQLGAKVAIGDVSDGSHVGGAALNCFCAILVAEAAEDERDRAFAASPDEVIAGWVVGVAEAAVTRVIWVGAEPAPEAVRAVGAEFVSVVTTDRDLDDVVGEVRRSEEAARIDDLG